MYIWGGRHVHMREATLGVQKSVLNLPGSGITSSCELSYTGPEKARTAYALSRCWRDGSEVLAEDLDSVPSIHMVAYNHPCFQEIQ